ncbi:gliding motility-associated C-terminal domain-containing protein [Pustulibacterium marinum]|uniref:Gliding motility-associated C-terminal domain-containing protein n=1 Tax=Pustulibacterium marinum TaxID=1224947 RepID=A0A1I7HJG2_9FLAO|nr:T9SS type B sorting domain-containing protein [Pustulibacterium marinum]SFU60616.1 gliding motility-associated C-terminal domain-containing protein [Pustulibacterium marinum]
MKIKLCITFLLVCAFQVVRSQDVSGIVNFVCTDQDLLAESPGSTGINTIFTPCSNSALTDNLSFYLVQVQSGSTFTFLLTPENNIDFDFVSWKNPDLSNLGTADRGSQNNPTNVGIYTIGLDLDATELCEGAGVDGMPDPGLVRYYDVVPGDIILIAIDRWSGTQSGFTLSFGGDAVLDCVYEGEDYYACDNDGDGSAEFDLDTIADAIASGSDDISITFYDNQESAEVLGTDNLNTPYTLNASESPMDVYASVTNEDGAITMIQHITFNVNSAPAANEVADYIICDSGALDGYATFDLTAVEAEMISDNTGFTITYYQNQAGAENQVSPITTPEAYTNTQAYEQEVFARLEDDTYGCFTIVPFQLVVSAPEIGTLEPLSLCDDENNDGFETFDLTLQDTNVLDDEATADYSITYYETETAAIDGDTALAISTPEAYTNTVENEQTIYVRLEELSTGCYNVASFVIEVLGAPETIIPTPLYGCDDATMDGMVTFMLTEKNAEIVNGQQNISVTYYASQEDLENEQNPLPSSYTNVQTPTQTLYVLLENVIAGCQSTTTLQLVVSTPPVAVAPAPMEFCDPDNDGYGEFDIDAVVSEVVPDDGDYIVTVHETESDADTNVNAFESMYENIYPNDQTMYVRVEDAITGCYDVAPLELIVHPTPVVPVNLEPLEICDDSVADGLAEFDLSLQNEAVYGTQSTSEFSISYHATEDDAIADQSPLPTYYTNITPFLQTIYVRLETNATGCYTVREFDLIVHPNPVINPDYDNELALCDDFGEDGDETLIFDLTVENEEVTGGVDGYMVLYYETLADAENNTNQIIPDTAYTNLENPQTVFVRVEDAITGCTSFTTVTLRVLNNPTPLSEIDALEACDDDDDGDENNGQTVFDLTIDELAILNGETGVTPTYYESYDDAFAGTNAISNPESYYNVSQYNQTIYVAVTNDATGCLTITDFELIVHPLPEVTEEPMYYLCEVDNNDVATIPLTDMDSFVLDGGDATDLEITYHTTEAYAEAGTHEIVGAITVNGTMTIYARVEDLVTGCAQTVGYEIDIEQAPLAGQPEAYALCESLTEDGYYNNDGVEIFDLTTLEETILDGQDPNGYTVSFYETYDNALAQISAIEEEGVAAYESAGQIIYAVVTNNDTGCTNGEPIEIELIVEPMPEVTLELKNSGIICIDATDNPVIGTDLGSGYTYEWSTGATTPTIEVTQGGEYFVTVTNTNSINQCSYTSNSVIFEEASLPSVTPTVIQSEMFSGNNTVEVTANGSGSSAYEYQLDDNPVQDSGLFTNVEPGVHTVTITEVNGCGSLTIEVSVVDYMKYFTPNGDGVNDTWRIIGLENQENAQVFIFDRYGKLIKQLNATSEGWDGTYNGKILTSNDYWFKVVYTEPSTGEVKEYTDHFAMKK